MTKIKNKFSSTLKNKKGFTLVEIIVVLVILAIMAAVVVPSMLGFIDKAKQSEETANARAIMVSTQAIVSEEIAANGSCSDATINGKSSEVATLSGCTFTDFSVTMSGDEISQIDYQTNDSNVTIEANKKFTITDK